MKHRTEFRADGRRTLLSRYRNSLFAQLYNYTDEYSTGRACILWSNFLGSVCGIFTSGTFYTAFLMENGIDIVQVGVISFIPYISWIFNLLTPRLFAKIKKRRFILLFSNVFYYSCVVLATTVMPNFVTDTGKRTVWFAVLLLLGNSVNALLGGGATAWHIRFLPKRDDHRSFHLSTVYFIYNLVSTVTALGAAALADALSGSPMEGQIITVLRYVSFALAILNTLQMYLIPKEYPYEITPGQKLRDVFTVPLKNRKFLLTIFIAVMWQLNSNFTANTYSYYLLDTLKIGYSLTYLNSVVCVVSSLFLMSVWNRAVRRFGWFKVMAFNCFFNVLMDFFAACATEHTVYLYIISATISGLNLLGAQKSLAQMFYINLPKKDTDLYNTFYNFVLYLGCLVGGMVGTWALSALQSFGETLPFFGVQIWPMQLLTAIRGVFFGLLGVYVVLMEARLQPDASTTA